MASFTIARKFTASFSNRVAILRHSLSAPMHRSTTFRFRYASLSKSGFGSWFDFVGITSLMRWSLSQSRMCLQP
jgi:hypothetical protein